MTCDGFFNAADELSQSGLVNFFAKLFSDRSHYRPITHRKPHTETDRKKVRDNDDRKIFKNIKNLLICKEHHKHEGLCGFLSNTTCCMKQLRDQIAQRRLEQPAGLCGSMSCHPQLGAPLIYEERAGLGSWGSVCSGIAIQVLVA